MRYDLRVAILGASAQPREMLQPRVEVLAYPSVLCDRYVRFGDVIVILHKGMNKNDN